MFYLLIASKVDAMEFLFNSSLVVESAAPEVGAGFSGGVGGGLAAQSCTTLAIPWTIAHQAPLSMGFSRQEYWSGLPCLPLPNSGIKPVSLRSPAWAGGFFTTSTTWEVQSQCHRAPIPLSVKQGSEHLLYKLFP